MGSSDELFVAIDAGDVDAVRSLIGEDAAIATARDAEGVSSLMRARYRSDAEITGAILAAAPALDVFEAAAFGNLGRLAELLAADASLATAYSADGFTALHLAAFFGKPEAAELLLVRNADVDARGRGWMTGTPLHSAASANHTDVATVLLNAGADPNTKQAGGWTPLHAAAMNGNRELVELLLAHGADPAATNDDGATVLALAEGKGDADAVARIRQALG